MKILIAEDDHAMLHLLKRVMAATGHELLTAADGAAALELALREQPEIVVTDWMMPKINGVELCARLRASAPGQPYVYIILLTARDRKEDIVCGLEAGADDYVVKPFDPDELLERIRVGERIVRLEGLLRRRNEELERSLNTIRRLKSLLPICMFCKRIRADEDYWQQVDAYIHEQTGVDFTHGVCPECFQKQYPEIYERIRAERAAQTQPPADVLAEAEPRA